MNEVLNILDTIGIKGFVQGKAHSFWGIIIVNKLLNTWEVGISVGWVNVFPLIYPQVYNMLNTYPIRFIDFLLHF